MTADLKLHAGHEPPAWWRPRVAAERQGRAWAVCTSPASLEVYAGSSLSQPMKWDDEGSPFARSLHSLCFVDPQPSDPQNTLYLAVLFQQLVNEGEAQEDEDKVRARMRCAQAHVPAINQ